jgi:hypothetical protein
MLRPNACFRVLGAPASGRSARLLEPEPAGEYEVWYVDSPHCSVAALWLDGVLWLAGDCVFVDGQALALGDAVPPGFTLAGSRGWVAIGPEVGCRYVATAGAARAPDPSMTDRQASLDALLDVPAAPEPGRLAKLFGKRAPPIEAVALVIEFVDEPDPENLDGWLAALRRCGIEISWAGHEGDIGFHHIRKPLRDGQTVQAALLEHAREDAVLTKLVREYTQVWIEDGGEPPEDGRLVPDDPTRGWITELELDDVVDDIHSSTGTWINPYTSNARRGHRHAVPGAVIIAALRRHLEHPTVVAVHSAPVESVLAVHLFGGINRETGELVGFAVERVWT